MLRNLYNMWGFFGPASIAIAIITFLISIRKVLFKDKDPSPIKTLLINFLFACSLAVVLSSFFVNIVCTKVPLVYGKTVREAIQIFDNAGLKLMLPGGVPNDDDTLDMIVTGQNYEGNQPVPKGTEITVYVNSKGVQPSQKTVIVPNVIGERYIDILEKLSTSELRYRVIIADGTDISLNDAYITGQSIRGGEIVSEGSLLELELSSKQENTIDNPTPANMVEVPNIINMEESAAVKALEDWGLIAQVWWLTGTDESLDLYYIIDQSIPAGSSVPVGTLVELERSSVKLGTPVTVPNVFGMEQSEATKLLKNIGLDFQVWWTEENNIPVDQYYIINQSIPAGSSVSAGTLVKLELSAAKPNG